MFVQLIPSSLLPSLLMFIDGSLIPSVPTWKPIHLAAYFPLKSSLYVIKLNPSLSLTLSEVLFLPTEPTTAGGSKHLGESLLSHSGWRILPVTCCELNGVWYAHSCGHSIGSESHRQIALYSDRWVKDFLRRWQTQTQLQSTENTLEKERSRILKENHMWGVQQLQ